MFAAAGLYQLTPLKRICLSRCRTPLAYLIQHWRPHITGAIRLGLGHGTYCVGCCWFVMALLFVEGVMNLVWVVALAAFVMAERLLPFGKRVGRLPARPDSRPHSILWPSRHAALVSQTAGSP